MEVKIKAIYSKSEDIVHITSKLASYSFSQLKKHPHFEFSLMEKLTDEKLIEYNYKNFYLLKTIEIRENSKGEEYYSLNYKLPDETFIVLAISFSTEPPTVINAFHAKTNYKSFEKSLRKNYWE